MRFAPGIWVSRVKHTVFVYYLCAGVRQFMQRSIAAARSTGAVSTLMGRRRPIPGLTGDFQDRSAAERKVVNSQIQVWTRTTSWLIAVRNV